MVFETLSYILHTVITFLLFDPPGASAQPPDGPPWGSTDPAPPHPPPEPEPGKENHLLPARARATHRLSQVRNPNFTTAISKKPELHTARILYYYDRLLYYLLPLNPFLGLLLRELS